MFARSLVTSAAAIVVLAGCAGASSPGTVPPQPVGTPVAGEQTCTELSDVGTLIANWQFAQSEERLVGNEYEGGMRLASRLLHRVPVEPGTPLADAVLAAQAVTPTGPPGSMFAALDPTSSEWQEAWRGVIDACNVALGADDPLEGFATEGWVGG